MTGRHATSRPNTHELMANLPGPSKSCPRCMYEGKHARPVVVAVVRARLRVVEGGAG